MKTTDQPFEPVVPEGLTISLFGLGGVGGIVARHLAIFLASLHTRLRLLLVDGDSFELPNASRMLFSRAGNKAAVTRDELLACFRQSQVTIMAVEEYLTPQNIGALIGEGGIAIVAVDNHATRRLVSDHAQALNDVCIISAGNDGVGADSSGRMRRGTFGNCQAFIRRGGVDLSPSLARFHPEIASPADRNPADKSCTELIASTPQILFANLTTAAACLNTLWLYLCGRLTYPELCFDIADGRMSPVELPAKLPAPPPGPATAGTR